MSGVGNALEDLDKSVNKSVPGGWVTIGALAAGGAGAYYGAGSAAGAGAGTGLTGAGSTTGIGATQAAAGLGGSAAAGSTYGTLVAPTAGTTFGALSAGSAPVVGAALTPAAAAAVPGSAEAIAAAKGATTLGAASPSISPMQAMLMGRMVGGGFGQQTGGGTQSSSVGFKPGQPVNSADPIAALLAPKIKKKERFSLL